MTLQPAMPEDSARLDLEDQLQAFLELVGEDHPEVMKIRFVLENGMSRLGVYRPKGMRKRGAKNCFGVAAGYVLSHPHHLYVEGYGIPGSLWQAIAVNHAWVLKPDGDVLDLVWDAPERSCYIGVAFNVQQLAMAMLKSATYSVLPVVLGLPRY